MGLTARSGRMGALIGAREHAQCYTLPRDFSRHQYCCSGQVTKRVCVLSFRILDL